MFITMETLSDKVSRSYGSVVQFGDYVFAVDLHWQGGFTAEIYEFVEDPNECEFGSIECRLGFFDKADSTFYDAGHAIEWCINRIK